MILNAITLQAFRSFDKETTCRFDTNKNGLHFLTGRNEVEPELGANGTGKSSLWDGMFWILFGKTSRNLSASDVRTWYATEKTIGVLNFNVGPDNFRLRRTWSPNSLSWSINGTQYQDVLQVDVEDRIKLNKESFLYSVLISQTEDKFLDLKPSAMGELFGTILDLDKWLARSDHAKKAVSHFQGLAHDLGIDINTTKGKLMSLREIDFQEDLDRWQDQQKEQRTVITNRGRTAKTALKKSEKSLTALKAKIEDLKKESQELDEGMLERKKVDRELENELREARDELAEQRALENTLQKEIDHNQDTVERGESHCPVCKQEIDTDLLNDEIEKLEQQRLKQKDIADKQLEEVVATDARIVKRKATMADLRDDQRDVDRDLAAKQNSEASIQREITRLEKDVKSQKLDLERLDNEENPYKKKMLETQTRIKTAEEQLESWKKDYADCVKQLEIYRYWVKGFKDLRLFLIDESLLEFELEVNSCLNSIGMPDWRIEFAVDSVNKSGSVKKGFSVMIHSPYTDKPVPWAAWSGGEAQRLRLAGSFGLINLILRRRGIDCNLEVWDEPSQFLSEEGIEDFTIILAERGRSAGKQVWLVDHRTNDFGGFESIATAVKTSKGTHFEYSDPREE